MNLDLAGKNALVCGSTQGLGWAIAQELAKLGACILLLARSEEKLKQKTQELCSISTQSHSYLVADFQNPFEVEQAVNTWLHQTNRPIHILVNNTGGPASGELLEASSQELNNAFNAHVICNQLLTQLVVPGMKDGGFGRIINVISTSVKIPIQGLGVSNTIRGAVASWSKTLATELGPYGITVNNVLPGYTETSRLHAIIEQKAAVQNLTTAEVRKNMIQEVPVGRIGLPEEFGAAVAFLCTPAAAYINGVNLPVDGGKLGCL